MTGGGDADRDDECGVRTFRESPSSAHICSGIIPACGDFTKWEENSRGSSDDGLENWFGDGPVKPALPITGRSSGENLTALACSTAFYIHSLPPT